MAFNNNSSSEAFESLKQYMVENHRAKLVSGGREILKRCHICGDSRDQSDAHMYIGMKNGSIVYNCFKCNAGGVVDGKFLRDMDCYDPNIIFLCQIPLCILVHTRLFVNQSFLYPWPQNKLSTRLSED